MIFHNFRSTMHLTIRIFLLLTTLVIAFYHVEGKDCDFVRMFIFAILSYTCSIFIISLL